MKKYKYQPKDDRLSFKNFDKFYDHILSIVKSKWNKIGNELIGISDDKMYRILSGKQRDFETIYRMADFMKIDIWFMTEDL